MKENNSPLENLKDEYKMLLLRDKIQQNKWIKRLSNKHLSMKIKVIPQEDKELLIMDLSAKLSYGVICNTPKGDGYLCSINQTIFGTVYGINIKATKRDYFNDREVCIKPYLRPMSSMTDEEKDEYYKLCDSYYDIFFNSVESIDWLNKNMFDYRRLIQKDLAIAVTKDNNPYK